MRRTVFSILSVMSLALGALPVAAQPSSQPEPGFTRVIVELDPHGESPRALAADTLTRFGGQPGLVFEHAVQGFVAELPQAAITALMRNPNVVRITPDRIVVEVTEQETPTGYDRTEADLLPRPSVALTTDGCPVGETCTDADIAVLDTGVNAHPDLNVVGRADCTSIIVPGFGSCVDQAGFDGHGHGSHVAGIAAALDNDIGVIGIAPGARIHSVKVLGDDGTGYLGSIIGGVDWVTARSGVIDVVNMSLSGEFDDATLNTAIANSVATGITYTVAAGNSSHDAAVESPANHPDVITVSAVADADGGAGGLSGFRCRDGETDDTLATFSNFGQVVDIAAPGTCILSTYNDGGYDVKSGTSMASPQVAGAAALYVAINGRDASDDGQIDKSDADAVKAALIAGALPQGDACGIDPASDPDGFAEPMLFLNGTAFDGTSECHQIAPDPSPPIAPTVSAQGDGYPIQLEWSTATDPESGILEYRLYRDTVPSSGLLLIARPPHDSTSFTDRNTTPGATYSYEVEALNLQFGVSARSNRTEGTSSTDDPTDAGRWSLEDGAGASASDSSAWRRPGTLVNGPAWEPIGKIGGAITLDGADDRLDLDPAILDGAGDASFAVWIKTTKTGTQTLVSGANTTNDNEFSFQLVNDTLLRFYTGYSANTGVQWDMDSVADGQWHHLVLLRNDTLNQVWAYRDGVSLGGWGLSIPMEALEVDALVIGQDQDGVLTGFQSAEAIAGGIDEVRVFTRLLTISEIEAIALRDLTPPTGPDQLTTHTSGANIDLTWEPAVDAQSGIDSYEVWRDNGAGGPKQLLDAVPGAQTSFRDVTARPGVTYTYAVAAINGGGITGSPSPDASGVAGSADPSLAGWWAFDDAAGMTAADWSPAGADGDLSGSPVWDQGRYGGALTFDDATDLVSLDHAALDGADDLTVSMWVKTTFTSGVEAVISGANTGNDAEYEWFLVYNPDLRLRLYTGATSSTYVWWPLPTAADGEWHHIAAVRHGSGDQARLYFDGVDQGLRSAVFEPLEIELGGLILGQDQDVVGGGFDPTQAFAGSLDDARFYRRLLTEAEVRDLAGMGVAGIDTTPPTPPTGLTAVAADSQITLDWNNNPEPDLAGYTIHRSTSNGGPYTQLATGLTTPTYLDTDVTNATTYYYVATATDTNNNTSTYSTQTSATPHATVEVVAMSEATAVGTISANDLTATFTDDGVAEALTEHHGGGKPSSRVSDLDHRWTFEIGSPVTATLLIDAHWPSNSDGDDFAFEYSIGGSDFVLLLGVTSSDVGVQEFGLPEDASGTIVVRVVDTDETPGNASLDTVFVDMLVLRTSSGAPSTTTVRVVATDAAASEFQLDPGEFTLTRSTSTGSLTVDIEVTGNATPDSDYLALPTQATFADGESSITITVIPLDDTTGEGPEDVVLTVLAGADYRVGVPVSDAVVINDDDQRPTDSLPLAESSLSGSASGGLAGLGASDNDYEVITEEPYAGGNRTRLEHVWTFDVTGGSTVTVHVEAFRSGSEPFVFAYSTDGSTWVDMFSITNNTDPGSTVSYPLPPGTTGTLYVRVLDSDRSKNDGTIDSISVDTLFIRSE